MNKSTDNEMSKRKRNEKIVTWYKPEEKLPPDDRDVIVTFSGSTRECMFIHAFGIAKCCSECEYEKPAWGIFGFSVGESMKMHVEAWADLDPYGMGEGKMDEKNVQKIIEELKAEICDHYCKYANYIEKYAYYIDPDKYNEIIETRCAKCPLNRL